MASLRKGWRRWKRFVCLRRSASKAICSRRAALVKRSVLQARSAGAYRRRSFVSTAVFARRSVPLAPLRRGRVMLRSCRARSLRRRCISRVRKRCRILCYHAWDFSRAAFSGRLLQKRKCSSMLARADRAYPPSMSIFAASLLLPILPWKRRGECCFACEIRSLPHASTVAAIFFAAFAMLRRRSSGRQMRQAVRGAMALRCILLRGCCKAIRLAPMLMLRRGRMKAGLEMPQKRRKKILHIHRLRRSILPHGRFATAHFLPLCMGTSLSTAAAMPAASVRTCVRKAHCRQTSKMQTSY